MSATKVPKSLGGTSRFTSVDQTITASGTLTLTHGLEVVPFHVSYLLKCITAEAGYAVGDLVVYNHAPSSSSAADQYGLTADIDATNIYIKFGSLAATLIILNKSTGNGATITNTSWKLIVKAEA